MRHLLSIFVTAAIWLTTAAFAATHHVSILNFSFVPQTIVAQTGDSVIFTNGDSAPHTATAVGGQFDSGNLNSGATWGTIVNSTSSVAYVCLYHSEMTGLIQIGSGSNTDTTWVEQNSPTSLPLADVRFWDANTGWIAGEQGVLRTTNGGDTWTQTGTADDCEAVYFVSATEGWVCGNNGMILHTSNGGLSWTPQASGVGDKLRDIWFADAQHGWAAGKDGILIHTTDGGQNWAPQASPAQDDLRGIHMLNAQEGWIVGSDGVIMHTTNGGDDWVIQLSVPGGEEDEFEAVFALDPNHVWAVGGQGRIYSTSNGGQSWSPQTSGTTVALMDVHFTGFDIGWMCGAGGFLAHGVEGGAMWHTQTPPATATFNGVYFVSDTLGYLVTADGRIFRGQISETPSASPPHHHHTASSFGLVANYPNPFNPSTTIEFTLESAGHTTLTVFDILGQQIAQPLNGTIGSGAHKIQFQGAGLPSGAYYYQLASNGQVETRRMLLVK
ncbi:MAG: T9SS type A sorting domain-containing protein [bacterium]|nr:T9SS type A sorting domain-containing protein [bacterium]